MDYKKQALDVLFSVSYCAEYLHVSEKTIRKWCATGILPARKVGKFWRVRKGDLIDFVESDLPPGVDAKKPDALAA
jgi:excisionase family DNA binding protein